MCGCKECDNPPCRAAGVLGGTHIRWESCEQHEKRKGERP